MLSIADTKQYYNCLKLYALGKRQEEKEEEVEEELGELEGAPLNSTQSHGDV